MILFISFMATSYLFWYVANEWFYFMTTMNKKGENK